jgi:hypothetical protein
MVNYLSLGCALHVRLAAPGADKVVCPSCRGYDRNYLLLKANSLDEARRWCDATDAKLARHGKQPSDFEVSK